MNLFILFLAIIAIIICLVNNKIKKNEIDELISENNSLKTALDTSREASKAKLEMVNEKLEAFTITYSELDNRYSKLEKEYKALQESIVKSDKNEEEPKITKTTKKTKATKKAEKTIALEDEKVVAAEKPKRTKKTTKKEVK